jgi:hypothetical protein
MTSFIFFPLVSPAGLTDVHRNEVALINADPCVQYDKKGFAIILLMPVK